MGKTVTDCRALVEIDRGAAYLGAVLGCAEEGGTVSGNLFTHDTLNGINGVSYLGKAEPVSFAVLSQGASADFTRFRLIFRADGKEIETFDFSYGDALTQLPEIPAKSGCSASWPEMDYSHLTFSRTLDAEYTAYHTALTALGDPPEVQYKLPDSGGDYVVWVETSGGWEQREAEIDGTYLVFQADGDSVVFMVEESGTGWSVLLLAASGCAAAAVVVLILLRVRKGRKGNKRASR
ncbi:hypothetical protein [Pseudoflavonifractor phocaeensis]|uniref:hypothetical protein n=1 Tax=Pseudoflavonifractor phocaeensis TaxID=1870988 RepID=UPI00195A9641|nr:hypothetical protein [Pseudoflavonifractor phocaeensis]MBM6871112.1 hypothetical protein [Pseudoflavonifractor phocaeensis]